MCSYAAVHLASVDLLSSSLREIALLLAPFLAAEGLWWKRLLDSNLCGPQHFVELHAGGGGHDVRLFLPNAAPIRIYSCLKRRKTSAQPSAQSCLLMIWHDGCSFLGPVPPYPGVVGQQPLWPTAFCGTTCWRRRPRCQVVSAQCGADSHLLMLEKEENFCTAECSIIYIYISLYYSYLYIYMYLHRP